MKVRCLYLTEKIPWFGAHAGYEVLPRFLEGDVPYREVAPRRGITPRVIGKMFSILKGAPARDQSLCCAEMEFVWKSKRWPGAVSHILYSDHHLPFLKLFSTLPRNLWGTLHFPPSQWTEAMFAGLKHLSFAITLYQRDIGAFERYAGKDRVRFVHYGVDTEFFRPGGNKIDAAPRVLYGGLYLRNTGMLARVIRKLHSAHPSLRFDLLVPERARADPDLQPLRGHPAVAWHAGLDDEQLRELYRQSQVLLLPINESGANTTVVEALACGLPIVTTDVGGIRDYGGGTLFPLVANDDDDAMVALVEAYLSRPAWRDEVAMKGRQFAEETLAWPLIARRHLALYKELAE